jgi:hypothetical protein
VSLWLPCFHPDELSAVFKTLSKDGATLPAPWDGSQIPVVTLEYPGQGASETSVHLSFRSESTIADSHLDRFALMHPKIRDGYDYHPVADIRKVQFSFPL